MFQLYVSPSGSVANIRNRPSLKGFIRFQMKSNHKFLVVDIVSDSLGFYWYKINLFNKIGYVRFDVAKLCFADENSTDTVYPFDFFLNQREIRGNMGFVDPEFDKLMRDVKFVNSHAWCAYFVRLLLDNLNLDWSFVSPSVVKTKNDYLELKAITDLEDSFNGCAVAIWQTYKNGRPQSTGHMGLAVFKNDECFVCFEGNTNALGGREGVTTALKIRSYKYNVNNGLRFMGFIPVL